MFKVPISVRQHRLDICKACENLLPLDVCKLCKCYMPGKTYVSTEKCPIDKWGPIYKKSSWQPQKKVD